MKDISFSNFVIDGVSLKSNEIINTEINFLLGKINYSAGVDNKYNVKSNYY